MTSRRTYAKRGDGTPTNLQLSRYHQGCEEESKKTGKMKRRKKEAKNKELPALAEIPQRVTKRGKK